MRGPGADAKWSVRGGCCRTVTTCAARSASSTSSPHPVTTTSCMLNTARTLSAAPSAYRNCAHGSTYVRFGSTTRKPYGRRSRSTVQPFSLPTDSETMSSLQLLCRLVALVAGRVRDGLMLNRLGHGMSGGFPLDSQRLAHLHHHRPHAPFDASRRVRRQALRTPGVHRPHQLGGRQACARPPHGLLEPRLVARDHHHVLAAPRRRHIEQLPVHCVPRNQHAIHGLPLAPVGGHRIAVVEVPICRRDHPTILEVH